MDIKRIKDMALESGHVLFGLGIVENGYCETARVQALLPSDFESGEKALLKEAKAWMARLPFEKLDLLIVDEMGKNLNGAGTDQEYTPAHRNGCLGRVASRNARPRMCDAGHRSRAIQF